MVNSLSSHLFIWVVVQISFDKVCLSSKFDRQNILITTVISYQ